MMISTMRAKNIIAKTVAVLLAIAVWQAAASYVGYKILLPGPIDVLKRLPELCKREEFMSTVTYTFGKIIRGFLCGFFVGVLFGLLAGRYKIVETLLWPYMVTAKSIPVASFTIVALIWLSSSSLSTFVSFLMVTPIVYTNTLHGYKNTDPRMKEMAKVFRLSFYKRFIYITLPSIKPFLLSASSISFGLAWKSGVAAELIAAADNSVGGELYYTKINIITDDLFAWTFIIILISVAFENLFSIALKGIYKAVEKL